VVDAVVLSLLDWFRSGHVSWFIIALVYNNNYKPRPKTTRMGGVARLRSFHPLLPAKKKVKTKQSLY